MATEIKSFIATTASPFVVALLIAATSMYLSDIELRLNTDIHHWGLIFSSAADLSLGRTPFIETYEIYGLLSSLLNAAAFLVFGATLVVLGQVASVFYALSLILSYIIARRFLGHWFSLFVPLFMFLLHPYVVYPWPNYLSYNFLLAGIYFLLRNARWSYFVAGLLFGLCILARQSMVLSVVPIVIVTFTLKIWQQHTLSSNSVKKVLLLLCGASFPIVAFLLFLLFSNILGEWHKLTFTVGSQFIQLVSTEKEYGSRLDFFLSLLKTMYLPISASIRGIFLSLMAWSATGFVLFNSYKAIRRGRPNDREIAYILIACTTLFGFAQGAHYMGIFRWVNASSLGIILLVQATLTLCRLVLSKSNLAPFAVLTIFAFTLSRTLFNNPELQGNLKKVDFWSKDLHNRLDTQYHGSVQLLHGKSWSKRNIDALERAQGALLQAKNCGLNMMINTTENPLLPYLVDGIKKAQREPCRIPRRQSDQIFVDEVLTRQDLLLKGDAVLAARYQVTVPDHYTILWADYSTKIAVPSTCLVEGANKLRSRENNVPSSLPL